jgi:hypothetical protein
MIVNESETSGAVVIRAALWARRSQLAGIARDMGVSAEALHVFLSGGRLAPAVLEALTTRIWNGHLKYDPVTDTLQSANTAKPTPVRVPQHPPLKCGPKYPIGARPRLRKCLPFIRSVVEAVDMRAARGSLRIVAATPHGAAALTAVDGWPQIDRSKLTKGDVVRAVVAAIELGEGDTIITGLTCLLGKAGLEAQAHDAE